MVLKNVYDNVYNNNNNNEYTSARGLFSVGRNVGGDKIGWKNARRPFTGRFAAALPLVFTLRQFESVVNGARRRPDLCDAFAAVSGPVSEGYFIQ